MLHECLLYRTITIFSDILVGVRSSASSAVIGRKDFDPMNKHKYAFTIFTSTRYQFMLTVKSLIVDSPRYSIINLSTKSVPNFPYSFNIHLTSEKRTTSPQRPRQMNLHCMSSIEKFHFTCTTTMSCMYKTTVPNQ